MPNEFIQLHGHGLAKLVMARAEAELFVAKATGGYHGQKLDGELIEMILVLLRNCPDQAVPASTKELLFITDNDLRESLRMDIAEVNRALTDGEWKSATVVSGSVIEAILLWALTQGTPAAAAASAAKLKLKVKPILEEWVLNEYIEVAHDLGLLKSSETYDALHLARGFRNLIHPGRAIRLSLKCDRGTALAASAALSSSCAIYREKVPHSMIAAIYARKSTEQAGVADEQKSVARQVDHARAYAARRAGRSTDAHVYVDDGISRRRVRERARASCG